jgi:hypothetical protein
MTMTAAATTAYSDGTDPADAPTDASAASASASSPSSASALAALEFCRRSPSAVVVTVWPNAHSQAASVRSWLASCGASVVYEGEVEIEQRGGVAACMALYLGEEWLDSNCWYMESPLPSGPPQGPHAGAKWKAALTFTNDAPVTVFVVDAAAAGGALWRGKYGIREALRAAVPGALGNSCMHLTDNQADALDAWRRTGGAAGGGVARGGGGGGGGGYACDSSHAFHCARVLLSPSSVRFINQADVSCRCRRESRN